MRIALVLTAGTLMQLDMSCSGVAQKVTHSINPCGTVFNCDPEEYDLLTTDFPNWELDPTCTIPGQCGNGGTYPLPPGGGGTTTPTTPTTGT